MLEKGVSASSFKSVRKGENLTDFESLLHRAVMCDSIEIVNIVLKLLVAKGNDI